MRVAVTGGAGYIGSHTVVELLSSGHEVLIIDNFANAAADVPARIEAITGTPPNVVRVDITNWEALTSALVKFSPDAVLHFAGLKAVGESVATPLEYYRVNVAGSLLLIQAMVKAGCRRLVFSSSALVYGDPDYVPIPENHPLLPTNPYGHSKRMVEQIIEDWCAADPAVSAVNLRYFNPVGAHESAKIGEAPRGVPNNLMPYVAQVARGERSHVSVLGNDYDTPDGTGVRDYIHVVDLAQAHLAALKMTSGETGAQTFNVGTGRGYSVLEMIHSFQTASGREIPYQIVQRRDGDVATLIADPALCTNRLKWTATRDLDIMCRDAWAWQNRLE